MPPTPRSTQHSNKKEWILDSLLENHRELAPIAQQQCLVVPNSYPPALLNWGRLHALPRLSSKALCTRLELQVCTPAQSPTHNTVAESSTCTTHNTQHTTHTTHNTQHSCSVIQSRTPLQTTVLPDHDCT